MLIIVLLGSTAVFSAYTSLWAFPRFLIGVAMLQWLPGRVAIALLRIRTGLLETFLFSVLVGTTVSGCVYWALVALGAPGFIRVWPIVPLLLGAWMWARGDLRLATMPGIRIDHVLLLVLVAVALVPLAVVDFYWQNLVAGADGSVSFVRIRDVVFHLGLTEELTQEAPPGVPWLSGQPLPYHYGMDLIGAMLSRFSGASVPDVTVRFLPALFVATLALAAYLFARAWLRNGIAAVLVGFLVLLGEDLSFVPGLLLGSDDTWSAVYFQIPAVYSLYFLNPMLPAVAFLMAALLALMRFVETRKTSWAVVFGVLAATLATLKVFTAGHLVAAVAVAGAIAYLRSRSTVFVRPLLFATVLLLLPTLDVARHLGVASANEVWLELPPPYLVELLPTLKLDWLNAYVGASVPLLVALPLWLVGGLGMRLFALPAVVSRRWQLPAPRAMRLLLVVFVVMGLALSLFVSVKAPGPGSYNNAVWFAVGAKAVLWVLVAETLVVAWAGRRRFALGAAVAVVALSLPATAQFLATAPDNPANVLLPGRPERLTSEELALVEALDGLCGARPVLLAPEPVLVSAISLTSCRTPYLPLFAESLASGGEVMRRSRAVARFWSTWSAGGCRTDVTTAYAVSLIVVPRSDGARACGGATPRAVYENPAFRVLRLDSAIAAS